MKVQSRSKIFLPITLAQGLTDFVINIHYRELVHLCGLEQKTHLYKIIVISELTKCTASFPTSSPPHTKTHKACAVVLYFYRPRFYVFL
jgi:hypothetical protein